MSWTAEARKLAEDGRLVRLGQDGVRVDNAAKARKSYHKHKNDPGRKQRVSEKMRQHYLAHSGKIKAAMNQRYADGHTARESPNYRWSQTRYGAKRRSIEFDLSKAEVRKLSELPCYYCDELPPETGNGLDRVDNSMGYVAGNVVACCRRCNVAKNDQTTKSFVERCRRIAVKHSP